MKTVLTKMLGAADAQLSDAPGNQLRASMASGRQLVFPNSALVGDAQEPKDLPMPAWAVANAVSALAGLDKAVHAAAHDANLSELGREGRLREPRENALTKLSFVYNSLAEHRLSTDKLEADRYRAPRLDPANSAQAARDHQILEMITNTPRHKVPSVMRHLLRGDDEETAAAVSRAPRLSLALMNHKGLEDVVAIAWREVIDRRDPEGAQTLQNARALNEWAERSFGIVAGNMRQAVNRDRASKGGISLLGANLDAGPDGDRFKLYQLTRQGHAWRLFAITEAQAAHFETALKRPS